MKENSIKKVVEKFDYSLFRRDCNFNLYTKSGKPVSIIDDWNLNKNSNETYFIGVIDQGEKFETNTWTEDGIDVNGNNNNNLEMIKFVKPNYDYITEKDIPDTDDFKKSYENCCKYSFKMSPVEYLRYKEFCKDHRNCCRNTGTIGGGIYVSFMGTGLGNIVHAKCDICGLEVDLTDSESW